jgi:hypothetical protein
MHCLASRCPLPTRLSRFLRSRCLVSTAMISAFTKLFILRAIHWDLCCGLRDVRFHRGSPNIRSFVIHHHLTHQYSVVKSASSMRWAEHVARRRQKRNAYKVLVGKHKRLLGRPKSRWKQKKDKSNMTLTN